LYSKIETKSPTLPGPAVCFFSNGLSSRRTGGTLHFCYFIAVADQLFTIRLISGLSFLDSVLTAQSNGQVHFFKL